MAQCRPRYTTDPGPRFEQCVSDAGDLLRKASNEWAKGDPEEPSTEAILKRLLKIFEKEKFLRHPW